MKRVKFYEYSEIPENMEHMLQYFAKKVERYKMQDRKAKRQIDEANYITKELLLGMGGKIL